MALAIVLAGVAIAGRRRGPNANAVGQEQEQQGEGAGAVAPSQQHCCGAVGGLVVAAFCGRYWWDESSPLPSYNP